MTSRVGGVTAVRAEVSIGPADTMTIVVEARAKARAKLSKHSASGAGQRGF